MASAARLALLALALTALACTSARVKIALPEIPPGGSAIVTVEHRSKVQVYALESGQDALLETVAGVGSEVLRVTAFEYDRPLASMYVRPGMQKPRTDDDYQAPIPGGARIFEGTMSGGEFAGFRSLSSLAETHVAATLVTLDSPCRSFAGKLGTPSAPYQTLSETYLAGAAALTSSTAVLVATSTTVAGHPGRVYRVDSTGAHVSTDVIPGVTPETAVLMRDGRLLIDGLDARGSTVAVAGPPEGPFAPVAAPPELFYRAALVAAGGAAPEPLAYGLGLSGTMYAFDGQRWSVYTHVPHLEADPSYQRLDVLRELTSLVAWRGPGALTYVEPLQIQSGSLLVQRVFMVTGAKTSSIAQYFAQSMFADGLGMVASTPLGVFIGSFNGNLYRYDEPTGALVALDRQIIASVRAIAAIAGGVVVSHSSGAIEQYFPGFEPTVLPRGLSQVAPGFCPTDFSASNEVDVYAVVRLQDDLMVSGYVCPPTDVVSIFGALGRCHHTSVMVGWFQSSR